MPTAWYYITLSSVRYIVLQRPKIYFVGSTAKFRRCPISWTCIFTSNCCQYYGLTWFQALEVAGQVAGTTVSTSPLPFSAMASQCQTLGTDTRKKLTNWLSSENHQQMKSISPITTIPVDEQSSFSKVIYWIKPCSCKSAMAIVFFFFLCSIC